MLKKRALFLLVPILGFMLMSMFIEDNGGETRIIAKNPIEIGAREEPTGNIPCKCNIGGYCEVNGSLNICGFIASGPGGSTPTYWCGLGSGNCGPGVRIKAN